MEWKDLLNWIGSLHSTFRMIDDQMPNWELKNSIYWSTHISLALCNKQFRKCSSLFFEWNRQSCWLKITRLDLLAHEPKQEWNLIQQPKKKKKKKGKEKKNEKPKMSLRLAPPCNLMDSWFFSGLFWGQLDPSKQENSLYHVLLSRATRY